MLPKFRSVIAAIAVTMVLVMAGLAATGAVRIANNSASAVEILRGSTAFDQRLDWNQFSNPDSARRFQLIVAKQDATEPSPRAEAAGSPDAGVAQLDAAPAMNTEQAVAAIDAAVAADRVAALVAPIERDDAAPIIAPAAVPAPLAPAQDQSKTPPLASLSQPASTVAKLAPVNTVAAAKKRRVAHRHRRRRVAVHVPRVPPPAPIAPSSPTSPGTPRGVTAKPAKSGQSFQLFLNPT